MQYVAYALTCIIGLGFIITGFDYASNPAGMQVTASAAGIMLALVTALFVAIGWDHPAARNPLGAIWIAIIATILYFQPPWLPLPQGNPLWAIVDFLSQHPILEFILAAIAVITIASECGGTSRYGDAGGILLVLVFTGILMRKAGLMHHATEPFVIVLILAGTVSAWYRFGTWPMVVTLIIGIVLWDVAVPYLTFMDFANHHWNWEGLQNLIRELWKHPWLMIILATIMLVVGSGRYGHAGRAAGIAILTFAVFIALAPNDWHAWMLILVLLVPLGYMAAHGFDDASFFRCALILLVFIIIWNLLMMYGGKGAEEVGKFFSSATKKAFEMTAPTDNGPDLRHKRKSELPRGNRCRFSWKLTKAAVGEKNPASATVIMNFRKEGNTIRMWHEDANMSEQFTTENLKKNGVYCGTWSMVFKETGKVKTGQWCLSFTDPARPNSLEGTMQCDSDDATADIDVTIL